MDIHYEILDEHRKAILPALKSMRELGYYLAGGTALALQIGHRDSIDFDFFCNEPFDTGALFQKIEQILAGHVLVRTQEEHNTLGLLVDGEIRLSFMTYTYPLVAPIIEAEYFVLASLLDIGCMKLNAITSRSAYKDYVDLYFILRKIPLNELMTHLRIKMPTLDPLLALKSLVYFEDIQHEEILFKTTPVAIETIQAELIAKVREYRTNI
jgi:hypothetical protein